MSGDSTRDYELLSGDFKTILDVLVCSKEPLKWTSSKLLFSTGRTGQSMVLHSSKHPALIGQDWPHKERGTEPAMCMSKTKP